VGETFVFSLFLGVLPGFFQKPGKPPKKRRKKERIPCTLFLHFGHFYSILGTFYAIDGGVSTI
jgi:hypothetical protein